jgi:8-oxo-dGTP pyrophosphatase MutT (NUDIX family)
VVYSLSEKSMRSAATIKLIGTAALLLMALHQVVMVIPPRPPLLLFPDNGVVNMRSTSKATNDADLLRVYDWPPSVVKEPAHLTQVDPAVLIPRAGAVPIDEAHRRGLIHAGAWLHVTNGTHVLLLRRGADLVTCPGSWGLVGEHAAVEDETPEHTAVRAVVEELGAAAASSEAVLSLQQLTAHPVYYYRDYGPANGNRIDRQLTYLWRVQLDSRTKLDLDEEVADHRWIELDSLERWLAEDEEKASRSNTDVDFCHHTIRSLMRVGISHIMKKAVVDNNRIDR